MKTQDEIVAFLKREEGNIFGFESEVLLGYLDFDHAKPFLKIDAKPEEWKMPNGTPFPLGERAALKEMREYAEFAWGKAQDHRGLSANRSVIKLQAWAWLLGRDDVVAASKAAPYPSYGCPKLKVICEAFGFPVPTDEDLVSMMSGEPCTPDCEQGCRT